MNTEEKEILDSETQDNGGDDVVEETSSETTENESELSAEEYAKAKKVAEDQKRRAEKAEEKLKALKAQLEDKDDQKEEPRSEGQDTQVSNSSLSKEETILYARGFSEAEVEKAKSIAKIEGESPLVAAESDYFTIWKEREDNKKETQETQLGASKGSMKTQPKKDFKSEGLAADEHKALWKEKMGR